MSEDAKREPPSTPEEKADPSVLRAENALLQDRLLRALAEAKKRAAAPSAT